MCNNTDGSFHCLCNDGYTLSEDGRTCRDINECMTNTHGCQQLCVNTEGGFRCECNNTGYQLNADQSTCSGMQYFYLMFDCVGVPWEETPTLTTT